MPRKPQDMVKGRRRRRALSNQESSGIVSTRAAATEIDALRKKFKKAHDDGMVALGNHDFNALGDAIKREREIIGTQKKLIQKSIRKSKRSK